MRLLDLDGLTNQDDKLAYALAIGIKCDEVISDKWGLLFQLVYGAGVTIVTGPWGAEFWTAVSPEVRIEIQPDGGTWDLRRDLDDWCAIQVGLTTSELKKFLSKAPTTRHSKYQNWQQWNDYVLYVKSMVSSAKPIVVEEFPVKEITSSNAMTLINSPETLAADYEWDEETKEPICMSLATENGTYVVFDTLEVTPALEERLLKTRNTIFHQGRADLGTQMSPSMRELVHDAQVAAYLLGESELGLKELTEKFLGRYPMHYPGPLSTLPKELVVRYAGADARNTYDLHKLLEARVRAEGLGDIYERIELPLVPIIANMESVGSPVDIQAVMEEREELWNEEQAFLEEMGRRGYPNFDTDNVQREFLASNVGFDPGSLDKRVLSAIPGNAVDDLLHYRGIRTLRRNFLDRHIGRWEEAGRPVDFRLYPRFNQAGSAAEGRTFKRAPRTGRLSSSDPNFQNQPRKLRRIFITPDGSKYLYWAADYSALELNIAAALSGDENMLRVLQEQCPDGNGNDLCKHVPKHGDMHGLFQHKIFEMTGVHVERVIAKNGNFEQNYGGGADKLREICYVSQPRAFITLEQAEAVIGTHKELFHGYHKWVGEVRHSAHVDGFARTLYGRKQWLPGLYYRDPQEVAASERAAVSHTVQGTAADILKVKMAEVLDPLQKYGNHMAIQCHDELTGWMHIDTAEDFEREVKGIMEDIEINGLKLKVSFGKGKNWGEAK